MNFICRQFWQIAGILTLTVLLPTWLQGQDMGTLVDDAPVLAKTLTKALEKCPTFSADVNIRVSSTADLDVSSASGPLEYRNGCLRWEVRLTDVQSTQLSSSARTAVRQINGDQFVHLTRSDDANSYLVLSGAHACLQQPLPALRWLPKGSAVSDTVDGRPCLKSQFNAVLLDGTTNQVRFWKSKEQLPIALQIVQGSERFQIQFKNVHFHSIAPERFNLPGQLTKYNSVEDLVQSVLVDKVKKRLGLQ
jgi:hypothetical protein